MKKTINCLFASLSLALFSTPAAFAQSVCDADALQDSGSIYRICMPEGQYNGSLVIWAHGFQDAGTPVSIPEDQLSFGNVSIPGIINGLGFGFATNSYSKTGLAIVQGMDDIIDLVQIYADVKGVPERVFVTGASEGGIITTLLLERNAGMFDGGLAACGPVGDFPFQINYFGDSRALFDYFFPGVIPGDPFAPDAGLVATWSDYYQTVVKPIVLDPANRDALDQFVITARLPFDSDNYLETVETSVRDVLRYSVVNLLDAQATLGGFPYDNTRRVYRGSDDDALLNMQVLRAAADPGAIAEMQSTYATAGTLTRPLVTIHTTLDQQVPFAHQPLYVRKTASTGSLLAQHVPIRVSRYGHCNFQANEVLVGFGLMVFRASGQGMGGVGNLLKGVELKQFERIATSHGLPFSVSGRRLHLLPAQ